MLLIRPEQLKVLQEAQLRRFEAEAAEHVRSCWSEQVAEEDQDEEEVHATVAHALERADAHGIEDEFDVLRYINLMYSLGPDFDVALDWAAAILANVERPARDRMDELTEYALALEEGGGGGSST